MGIESNKNLISKITFLEGNVLDLKICCRKINKNTINGRFDVRKLPSFSYRALSQNANYSRALRSRMVKRDI